MSEPLPVGPTDRRHDLVLTAPPGDVDDVHAFLEGVWSRASDVDDLDRVCFETALIELAGNVVEHGTSAGEVVCSVEVTIDGGRLVAVLEDTGGHGDIRLEGRAMPDPLQEGGRGIPLIQALVDEVGYERVGNRNRWSIARQVGRAAI